jgi:release factor glutamine methyltransferase
MSSLSVSSLVSQGIARLAAGPHPEQARWDAEILLRHLLGFNKAWLLAHGDENLSVTQAQKYTTLLDRRFLGEPIQYILGQTEFYGLPFRVTPDVLIPRLETEQLVELAISLARNLAHPRIVDIGAGSGAIAVALAYHLADPHIVSIDLSEKALAVARENAARNGVAGRIHFLEGDMLTPVEDEQFDLVVSNPPYISEEDRASLSVEVRDYEPSLALFAGEGGLAIYRRLIPAAHEALASGGFLLMEIGYGQSEAVQALLAASGFERLQFYPDLQGIPRIAQAQRS